MRWAAVVFAVGAVMTGVIVALTDRGGGSLPIEQRVLHDGESMPWTLPLGVVSGVLRSRCGSNHSTAPVPSADARPPSVP